MADNFIKHIIVGTTVIVAFALVIAVLSTPKEGDITGTSRQTMLRATGMAIGQGDAVPDGYAPPFDYFESTPKQLGNITITPSGQNFNALIEVEHEGGWVWNEAYYLYQGEWHEVSLGDSDSGWLREEGATTITGTLADYLRYDGDDFFVAFYTCKRQSGEWRCGCDMETCNLWHLQGADIGEPASGNHFSVSPRELVVNQEEQASFNIIIPDGLTLYGYEFELAYDPAVLSFTGFNNPTNHLGSNGYPPEEISPDHLCVENGTRIEGEYTVITKIACTRVGTGTNGAFTVPNQIIKTVNFDTVAQGYSQVRVQNVQIAVWPNVHEDGSVAAIYDIEANHGAVIVR